MDSEKPDWKLRREGLILLGAILSAKTSEEEDRAASAANDWLEYTRISENPIRHSGPGNSKKLKIWEECLAFVGM